MGSMTLKCGPSFDNPCMPLKSTDSKPVTLQQGTACQEWFPIPESASITGRMKMDERSIGLSKSCCYFLCGACILGAYE